MTKQKPDLSVIVLSFNTNNLLFDCLISLQKVKNEANFEVIVSDNGSTDGSAEMVEDKFPEVKVIRNGTNLGFAAGNNRAKKHCNGKYVLFLNSDTLVIKETIRRMVHFMNQNSKVGASTCKIVLPDGSLDRDARRSFVTPWTGLVHIFLKLDRIFPKSRLFAQYWYGYISSDVIHEVDALQGAFFLTRKEILDEVGWFDEDYFLDAEDIDLSWKIKEKGWKIMYYPKVKILHLKGASKGKNDKSKKYVSFAEKLKYRMSGINSMELFVKKRIWHKYPLALMLLVLLGIKVLKVIRYINLLLFG